MRPAPFAYRRPTETDEVLALLGEHGDRAAVLAGGQSLVPLLAARNRRPELLVDINRLPGHDRVEVGPAGVQVGATVRQRRLELHRPALAAAPLLAQALPLVGRVGTRNRGTVVGSIAFADPAAELPSVLVAGGGEVRARSAAGERMIPAAAMFTGAGRTALAADEMVVGVRFGPARGAQCWLEFGRRPGDLPLVGVAASMGRDGDGRVTSVSLVCAGVHDRPWPVPVVLSGHLVGEQASPSAIRDLAHRASATCEPVTDARTTEGHRRLLVATLVGRALHRCAADGGRAGAA